MALSLPEPLLASLEQSTGFDRAAFISAHTTQPAAISIRYNDIKLAAFKGTLPTDKISWSPYGYYLDKRPSFTEDPLFHGGLYYVQEPGSQFLWTALSQIHGRDEPVRVLDLCGAPGGKSTLLAGYFRGGLIVANEVIKSRAGILAENCMKWGTGNMVVTCNDPAHFQRLQGYFDVILIDAPCSGSGLFRKDPEAINEWSPDMVTMCSKRQQRIIKDVLPALKEGGSLIYATCSYSPEEDEKIMDWLRLEQQMENVPLSIENEGITVVKGMTKPAGTSTSGPEGYKFFPDKVRSEGFFLSVFRKSTPEIPVYNTGNGLLPISAAERKVLAPWVIPEAALFFFKQAADILGIENKWAMDVALLQKNLFLKKAGIRVGEIKNKGLVPAHDLAVSIWPRAEVQRCQLDRAQSLQYLKRQEMDPSRLEVKTGWALVTYQNIGLGWIKVLPNRVNNYYPKGLRILKD